MEPSSHSLRSLPHRANHLRLSRMQLSLPRVPFSIQPRLSQPSPFLFRRPRNLTLAPVSQIGDVTSPRRSHSRLDGRVRLLPALNAFEEILHVVDRPVAEAVCPHNRIFSAKQAFVIHAKPVPV